MPENLRRLFRSLEPLDPEGQERKQNANADRHRENGEHERSHSGRKQAGCALGVDPHAAAFLLGSGFAGTADALAGSGVAGPSGAPGATVLPG